MTRITRLCWASSYGSQNDATHICCQAADITQQLVCGARSYRWISAAHPHTQQQIIRTLLLLMIDGKTDMRTDEWMNGQTEILLLHRPCTAYYVGSVNKRKNVLHVWTGLWEMAGRGRLATGPGRPASLTAWTLTLPAADGWHAGVVDEGRLSEALLAGHGTDTVSSSHEPTLSVTACSTIHSLTVCTHTQPQPHSSDLRHPTPGTCSRGYGLTLQLGLTADVGNGSFQWEVVGVWADVRRASKSCIWYYSKTAPVASHSSTHQLDNSQHHLPHSSLLTACLSAWSLFDTFQCMSFQCAFLIYWFN